MIIAYHTSTSEEGEKRPDFHFSGGGKRALPLRIDRKGGGGGVYRWVTDLKGENTNRLWLNRYCSSELSGLY